MWVINSSGELYSCGRNDYGQLGQGNTTNTSTLAQVGSLTDWRVIDGAENSFLATKTDYTLWACGNGVFGGLGQGNTTSYSSPVQVGSEEIWERPTNDNRGMSKALAN